MFEAENEKRDRKIFRVTIGLNVMCLMALVFYSYNLIFLGFLYGDVPEINVPSLSTATVTLAPTLTPMLTSTPMSMSTSTNSTSTSTSTSTYPTPIPNREEDNDGNELWGNLSWFLIVFITLTLVAVQTTMDLDMLVWRLGPDEDVASRMKKVRNWVAMSTWFLFISAVAFTCSIFVRSGRGGMRRGHRGQGQEHPTRVNPLTIFCLGFGGLLLRFVLLYMGHRYWDWLKGREEVEVTSTSGSINTTTTRGQGQGQGQGQGHARTVTLEMQMGG